jgi:protein-tyrosine phosphatase
VTVADESTGGNVSEVTGEPEAFIGDFFRRLDELESLAREITERFGPLPEPEPAADRQFELVVMCTGNRVRSPAAEGFLRALVAGLPVRITSAGVLDLGEDVPALPEAIETAGALGLDLTAHRAQCVLDRDLRDADLVIGFERRHVATAVVDAHARRERTFTMGELVALLQKLPAPDAPDPIERARQMIAAANALRSGSDEPPAELADPLGGPPELYRSTLRRVRDLSQRLAAGLFGADAVQPLQPLTPEPQPQRRRLLSSRPRFADS